MFFPALSSTFLLFFYFVHISLCSTFSYLFVFLFFSSQCYLFNSYFFLQYTSFYWCYQLYFPPFILRRSSLIIGYAFHIIVIFLLSSPTDLLILHFLFFFYYTLPFILIVSLAFTQSPVLSLLLFLFHLLYSLSPRLSSTSLTLLSRQGG